MTDSPYIPNTKVQYAFDSTSLGYLKTCPRLYYYTQIEGWTTVEDSVHLRFGQEYHLALQDYDLSLAAGISHDDAVHDVVQELLIRIKDYDFDHKTKTRDSLVRTVIWYLDKFKNDPAKTFILSDGKPAVEQSFRYELDWGPKVQVENEPQHYLLCGHLDRVVTYNDDLYVMDRKTTSFALTQRYFSQYEPHNQMSLYTFAGNVVLHTPVRGVIIDAVQVLEQESIFGRGFTFRTPDQLTEWLEDLRYWFMLQEQFAIADTWPMNDTACDKFGGCRFRSICSKSPSSRQRFLEGNFRKLPPESRWNPLAVR